MFYLLERYGGERLSWWVLGNLVLGYLSATKFTRSLVKYQLRLYREYKKYVIHVIEPNSPDKEEHDSDDDEISLRKGGR
jgi:hypothetical protein